MRLHGTLTPALPTAASIEVMPRTAWNSLRKLLVETVGLGMYDEFKIEGRQVYAMCLEKHVWVPAELKPAQFELLSAILVIDKEL